MPKVLTLRSRMEGSWHDSAVFLNAIESLTSGKSFSKAAMWLALAGKVQLGVEEALEVARQATRKDGDRLLVGDFTVELSNQEAKVLGREIVKLPLNSFGRNINTGEPAAPPLGTLYLAMHDWAEELGFVLPQSDAEDEDEEKEDKDG